ncbi:hypothetical protein C8T65DRAFT_606472, partial [Cerioporus squamosus]
MRISPNHSGHSRMVYALSPYNPGWIDSHNASNRSAAPQSGMSGFVFPPESLWQDLVVASSRVVFRSHLDYCRFSSSNDPLQHRQWHRSRLCST